MIFLPGFSFPPETAGRQEVTKERSSGPLGLWPRLPARLPEQPERSGAERHAASAPPEPLSARSPARPPARAAASPPRPARPAGPAPSRSRAAVQTGRRGCCCCCCVLTVPGRRCPAGTWTACRKRTVLHATGSGLHRLGDAAGGGQMPWLEVMA